MFSFIPPLLIILSLAGIIVIVVRRTPEVRRLKLPKPTVELVLSGLRRAGLGAGQLFGKLWHYVLEVKEFSKASRLREFPQRFSRIHFPKARLKFFVSSDSPEFFLRQAGEDLEKEDYAEAERKFIKVLEKDPKSELAYMGLGKLYLAQKKFSDAVETYKFLVKHFPENDSHCASLGQAYHGQKLYDKAVESYERAIELAPKSARRYVNLGLTLEAQKHLEEAILNYRRAVEMEKDNTQFLLVLSEALTKKGEKEEAAALLEHILILEPTNHLAREKLMAVKGY